MRLFFPFVFFALGGCATVYEECAGYERGSAVLKKCESIAREYDRVDYLEATFKPQMAGCFAQGGHSQWNFRGAQSTRMRRAIKQGNFDNLTKMEMKDWSCCVGHGICGLY